MGEALIGRVVNALGQPIDGAGPIETTEFRPIESPAPGIIERQPVKEPLQTGIKAIDSMIPIGRGSVSSSSATARPARPPSRPIPSSTRRARTSSASTSPSAEALYRGKPRAEPHRGRCHELHHRGVGNGIRAVAPAVYRSLLRLCHGRILHAQGKHVLIIYDDLSKHAVAYRALSLLIRRPPGREAYPGDVFYLHSRLLERAAKLSDELGGGSLTALPIIETQAGDVSAYIPTNVISITDGQIFLETELFHSGVMPAVNPGISVSRVGGNARSRP